MSRVKTGVTFTLIAVLEAASFCAHGGVVAYWDFSPGSAGIGDASGNGHHLMNAGVTFADGAAIFNGNHTTFSTRDWLDLRPYTNMTIEAFFKSGVNSGTMVLFEHTENFNYHWGATIVYADAGQLWGGFNGAGAYNTERTEPGAYSDGLWHHLAVVIHAQASGAEVFDMFLDGVKQIDVNVEGVSHPGTAGIFFIGSRDNSGIRFAGEMDDVRISDQALAPAEFLQTRTAALPPANVIAYWPFAPGSELADSSGNGHVLANDGVTFSQGAAVFNGAQAAFNTAATLDLSAYSKITIEAFVRCSGAGDNIVIEHGPSWNNPAGGIISYIDGTQGQLFAGYTAVNGGGYNYESTGTGVMSDGRWHHFALTVDLTKTGYEIASLYVDGWKQYEIGGTSSITPFLNDTIYIGSRANIEAKLTGEMDDVRISGRVLEPWEFLRARTVPPPAVIAHWTFRPGEELADSSGNNNVLTNSGVTFKNGAAMFNGAQTNFSTVGWLNLSTYPAVTLEAFIRSTSPNFGMVFEQTVNFNDIPGAFVCSISDPDLGVPAAGRVLAGWRSNEWYNFDVTGTGALADSRWHHLALVLDVQASKDDKVRLYLDGNLQTAVPQYQAEWFTRLADGTLFIGSRANDSLKFVGELDDVRISGRALAPAEFLTERTRTFGTLISIQ